MAGPYALDYNVIQHGLDRLGVVGEEYDQVMADLGIIESQALYNINKK